MATACVFGSKVASRLAATSSSSFSMSSKLSICLSSSSSYSSSLVANNARCLSTSASAAVGKNSSKQHPVGTSSSRLPLRYSQRLQLQEQRRGFSAPSAEGASLRKALHKSVKEKALGGGQPLNGIAAADGTGRQPPQQQQKEQQPHGKPQATLPHDMDLRTNTTGDSAAAGAVPAINPYTMQQQQPPQQQQHVTTSPFTHQQGHVHEFAPKITVIGVGGAGGNAVNNMISRNLYGVDFLVANTDAQHLATTLTDNRLQLGSNLTRGLGCGANPDAGRQAAMESRDEIMERIDGSHMVFITAGMGGGTGTGAAPVIADVCLQAGILTVAVVTKPFRFEGAHRMRLCDEGLKYLKDCVDTLIVIPNQNLFKMADQQTTLLDAFRLADDILLAGVRSVTDLMVNPGLINLDFADVQAVMVGMGNAMMGTGEADGEDRALRAAEDALRNPLLGDLSCRSAKGLLVNITGGSDITLFEVDKAATRITDEVEDTCANVIFGSSYDPSLEGRIRVSVVATGIEEDDVIAASLSSKKGNSSSGSRASTSSDVKPAE